MRTGTIIYVKSGAPCPSELEGFEERAAYPGADRTCLATTEAELSYGWWQLVARGCGRVQCVWAVYDDRRRTLITQGDPVRLCG